MSVTSFSRADLAERQRAFTGLLAHQLVNPWTRPALYALITRHEHTVDLWCARLDYRLVRIDQCYRLRRSPIDGQVVAPLGSAPPRRPLVLAIDDLHWTDRPSLRFVAYLLRRLEGLPVLVAATLRPAEPGADEALLAEIAGDPLTTSVQPGPLSVGAVEAGAGEKGKGGHGCVSSTARTARR